MSERKPTTMKSTIWRRKGLWVVIVLLLAGGGAAWYFLGGGSKAQAQSTTPGTGQTLSTAVKRGDITISASGSGTLIAGQTADLSFSTNGTVSELNVAVGDMVEEGDVLARLGDAEDLEANLASAQLALLQAQQSLEDLQQNADLSLAQAYQDLLTAQETYEDAVRSSEQTTGTRCSRDVTAKYAAAYERAQQKLANINPSDYGSDGWTDAKNDYDTAQANYTYCATYTDQEKITTQSTVEVAKVALQQAEKKYNELKDASGIDPDDMAVAEAAVVQAEKKLADAEEELEGIILTAPFAGKVISLAAGVGETVGTDTFITVADISHPMITVSVDENDLDKFTLGSTATVTFDVLTDQILSGTVTQINPQLVSTGPYRVVQGVVELDEQSAKAVQNLLLGMNASVEVVASQALDVLLVPVSALKEQVDGTYAVMVVGGDGQMNMQTVEVGLQDGSYAEILSGLEEGQMVSAGALASGSSESDEEEMPGGMPGGMPPDGGGMMPPQ